MTAVFFLRNSFLYILYGAVKNNQYAYGMENSENKQKKVLFPASSIKNSLQNTQKVKNFS